jgi:hypothetical protein
MATMHPSAIPDRRTAQVVQGQSRPARHRPGHPVRRRVRSARSQRRRQDDRDQHPHHPAPPDAGTVRVAGYDVVAEADKVRASIGVTGQFAAVDGLLTGEENLRMMARLAHLDTKRAKAHSAELLERFDLTEADGTPTELKRRAGSGHIVLELPTPDALAAAARMLPTATVDSDALSLRVAGSTDADTVRDTLVRLDDAHVSVANLQIVTPDLDDVFFALTGAPQAKEHHG